VKDDSDQLPLHVACETGCLDIVKLLLESDYPDSMYILEYDQQKHVEYRLPFSVNEVSADGKSPLFLACENGHDDIVDYLLNFTVKGSCIDKFSDGMSSVSSGPSQLEDLDVDVKPVKIDANMEEISTNPIQLPDVSDISSNVLYRRSDMSTSMSQTLTCVYIAVKNRHLQIVKKLAEFRAKFDLTAREKDVEYSIILKVALDNKDLLMLDTLLSLDVQDLNNFVFEEAVRSHPEFIAHFLKYKSSEDKTNHINKKLMKKEYSINVMDGEDTKRLSASDPRYKQIFPTESVNLRWQNLKVLSTVEPSWLVTAVNTLNPSMSSLNSRIPLFAVTRIDLSHNKITMVPIALLQLPSLCTLIASHNEITEFPSQTNFTLDGQFLEELDVQHNYLSTIPNYIFTLPRLRVLNASHNKIDKLPVSLWQSLYLKTIDLSYNKLEQLPRPVPVSVRKESEESIASENHFESLPDSLPLENDQSESSTDSHVIIHEVKRDNHWTDDIMVCDEAVNAAENYKKGLKSLKLGKNMLSSFPEFLSCCCPQLENLEMPYNHLKIVGNLGAYPKLLKTLDLSHNEIESLSDWQNEDERRKCFCAPRQYVSKFEFCYFKVICKQQ
jgi:Leucine-rich repeat (LRR) protein